MDLLVPAWGVAIEYDGSYWHAGARAAAKDEEKTAALTDAGWRVLRLREAPLPLLAGVDARDQVVVTSGAYGATARSVLVWLVEQGYPVGAASTTGVASRFQGAVRARVAEWFAVGASDGGVAGAVDRPNGQQRGQRHGRRDGDVNESVVPQAVREYLADPALALRGQEAALAAWAAQGARARLGEAGRLRAEGRAALWFIPDEHFDPGVHEAVWRLGPGVRAPRTYGPPEWRGPAAV